MNQHVKIQFLLAVLIFFIGCDSQTSQSTPKSVNEVKVGRSSHDIYTYSGNYDLYSLNTRDYHAEVRVYYYARDKVHFCIDINYNFSNCHKYFCDTAIKKSVGGEVEPNSNEPELDNTALFEDENGNALPLFEYYFEKDSSYIVLGIEPSRGHRMLLEVSPIGRGKQFSELNKHIIKLVKLSNVKQYAPMLPDYIPEL